ncbi:hypothetical protein KJ836_03440, partial [Patescibacteria group bacterium]|nr:hypothetical protein [Patescibacteria group bacterium]
MKIAVDLDDVLASFIAEFLKWYNPQHNTNWQFDDVVDYHWPNFMHITTEQAIKDAHDFFLTPEFADLPLMPGAKEFVNQLSSDHELYLVTARQHIVEDITRAWANKNFSNNFKEIVFANHYAMDGSKSISKGELCCQLGCEVLIDDDSRHISSVAEKGIKTILIDKPWNQSQELPVGAIRAYNWDDVVQFVN